MIILGLDPGLRTTGWGIISNESGRVRHVAHGLVRPPVEGPFPFRLLQLYHGIRDIVVEYKPSQAAIEEAFFNANPASTLKLGHARAAVMLAPAQAGIDVAEYSTRYVKKTLVGTGAADKEQVAFMVRRLLPGAALTSYDASDALAVAIAHAHSAVTRLR